MMAYACHPSYSKKCKIGESWSKPAWAKSKTLRQVTRAKRGAGVAQVVEVLCLANSKPSVQTPIPPKKKLKHFKKTYF
jgi:hypothetical protein